MPTPPIRFLKQKGIPFERVSYDHRIKGARFAAQATGYALEKTIKTLVVDLGRRQYLLALVPGHRSLSLRRLADKMAVKRAAMADPKTAQRLTGYRVGGMSPFCTRTPLAAVMEKDLLEWNEVLINAGRRGMMLRMSPADIVRAIACRVLPISRKIEKIRDGFPNV